MSTESAVSHPWRSLFSSKLAKEKLALVAIDEAHCIYEWFCVSNNILLQGS